MSDRYCWIWVNSSFTHVSYLTFVTHRSVYNKERTFFLKISISDRRQVLTFWPEQRYRPDLSGSPGSTRFFLFSLNRTQRHLLTPPAFKPKKTKATTVVAVSDECTFLIVRAAVTNSEAWALPEGRRRRWQSALCSDVQWKETKTFKINLTAFKPRQDPVHQTATRLKYWDRDKDKRFLWTVTETRSPSKCVLYWIRIQFLWPLHFTLELTSLLPLALPLPVD